MTMLSPVEDFWLRWHAEHSDTVLAERARIVLEAETRSPAEPQSGDHPLASQATESVLAEFEDNRLATFPRAKMRLDQLIELSTAGARGRKRVARQARRLFNDTRPLHHLPGKARQILEAAALLPPLEQPAAPAGVASHDGLVLLDGAVLADLSTVDQNTISCVLRFQHRGYRANRDPLFVGLRPYQQSQVRYLAALLQVSTLLDHSQTQTTDLKGAELLGNAVRLRVLGPKAEADGAYACRKAWLWQPIFHCDLQHILGPRAAAAEAVPDTAATPDEHVKVVFTRAMEAALRKWQSSLPGALAGDLSSLADLLSGIDETRAALGAFGSMLKRRPVKEVKGRQRWLYDLLAAYLRGQAALSDLDAYLTTRPPAAAAELQPMRDAWDRNGRRQLAAVRAGLSSKEASGLLSALNDLARTPPVRRRKGTTIHVAAPVMLDELCADLAEREARIAPDRPVRYQRYQDSLARLACALGALGGKATMGDEAQQLLVDLQHLKNRIERWLASNVLNDAIAVFLDDWAEQQARRKAPQLFGAQAVLAYRQTRRAQWSRLRSSLARDWRPLRASRLRRRANGLLKQFARHESQKAAR